MFDPAFLKGETWGEPGASVEHIETHAAHVFLVGERAYKIKKAIKLPYLDFSTRQARREVIERELAINRRFAPQIYLGTVEKNGEPVLVMKRFETSALLSNLLKRQHVSDELARELAETAAYSHEVAERRDMSGSEVMTKLFAQLSLAFSTSADIFPAASVLEYMALYSDALKRQMALLDQRTRAGLVRFCHGDMHCGNIAIVDGSPVLFDAIEFSDRIATVDVLYDLAFLLMDLLRHGERRAASILFNHYLHLRRGKEDGSGLAALPLFLATRAGVRALVTADLVHEHPGDFSLKERGDALDHFRASLDYLKPPPADLVCIGGLSGTGKTTAAMGLAQDIGAAPGAVHLRSDIERKILAGVSLNVRLPDEAYMPKASEQVYRRLLERAEPILAAGQSVIIDAVYAAKSERAEVEGLARRLRVRFSGYWLEASEDVMTERVGARVNDASDATPDVVRTQLRYSLGDIRWERIDASAMPEETLARLRERRPSPPAARA